MGNSIIRMKFVAIRILAAMRSRPNMNRQNLSNLKRIFEKFPQVKLAYFFGSQAEGKAGPLSDYNFAVYVETARKSKSLDIRLRLMDQIGRLLRSDKVDVVLLNDVASPEMKYLVISTGRLIFEREPYKVLVEPKILHEYFDFREMLLRYKLTSAG
jgi:predicted nucleotidyltransferase